MNDTQPLLEADKDRVQNLDGELARPSSSSTLSGWLRYFGIKHTDGHYQRLEDSHRTEKSKERTSFLQLFRFADRIDLLLFLIGIAVTVLYAACISGHFILFGRLTSVFATQYSVGDCQFQTTLNSTGIVRNDDGCPLGIDLNPSNNARLSKFCRGTDVTSRSLIALPNAEVQNSILKRIHWLLLLGLIEFACLFILHYVYNLAAKRQATRIRIRLFQALIQRSITYYDRNPAGELNSKLFENMDRFTAGVGFELGILIESLVVIGSLLMIALFVHWQLAMIVFGIVPVLLYVLNLFVKLTSRETLAELDTYSKAGHIVQEVFASLRTVLSLNGSDFERKRYEQALNATCWSSVRKGAVFGLYMGWTLLTLYILYSVSFIFGSFLMNFEGGSALSISDMIVVTIVIGQGVYYIGFISPYWQSLAEAQGAITPVFQLIDETCDFDSNESTLWQESYLDNQPIDLSGDIHFENVKFTYPTREDASVLDGLTLMVRAGETTALVGASGCGKTTCISLLLRLYEPSSGQIIINGRSIKDYDVKQLRQNIAVVNQEPILFGTSIYENIRYGKTNATRAQIEEAAQQANIHDIIMQLPNRYETLVGEDGIQLSGGEKQRVALARALVKRSALLLLDEATSALDNANEKLVQEALDRACKGRTTIIIAHRLTNIRNADQIYVLKNGKVIEQGTHDTLMAQQSGIYREMSKAQQLEHVDTSDHETIGREHVEEEIRIMERSRSLSGSNITNTDKAISVSANEQCHVFLRLMKMNSPEWLIITIGCIACLVSGIIQPIFAILLAKTINALNVCQYEERRRQVLTFGSLFFLLGFVALIVRFIQFTALALSGSKLTERIRRKAFACLLRQEVAYFDRPENHSGAICTRLASNALALQDISGTRIGMVLEMIAIFAVGLVSGVSFSWQLTLVAVAPILLMLFFGALDVQNQAKVDHDTGLLVGRISSLTVETLNNMRTVKQLCIEKELCRFYSDLVHQALIISQQYSIRTAVIFAFLWWMETALPAILYWYGFILVQHQQLDIHDLIIIFAFLTTAFQAFQIILNMTGRIGVSLSGARVFFSLFDRTPTIDNSSTEGQRLIDFKGQIEFDQVHFSYPSRPASHILNRFQLTIQPGQRVALVGISGCGKSTVIQLLERFYDVTHGQLRLDGVDIRSLNIQWVRSCFGLISQEPVLFDMTIAENITYGKENVPLEEIMDAAKKANIHHFIEQLPQGYDTNVAIKGSHLSGGEKQRIAIARALLRRPKVLLLDEATSALDSYNEQMVEQVLGQAQVEEPGRTSLTIAHRLSTIRSSDLICALGEGYLMESGTHVELMQQRGIYYRMLTRHQSM